MRRSFSSSWGLSPKDALVVTVWGMGCIPARHGHHRDGRSAQFGPGAGKRLSAWRQARHRAPGANLLPDTAKAVGRDDKFVIWLFVSRGFGFSEFIPWSAKSAVTQIAKHPTHSHHYTEGNAP